MATAFFNIAYKDKLPEIMRRNNFSYFEIIDAKDKVLVFCPAGYDAEKAAEYLQENLEGISEGEFSVNLYESPKKRAINKTFAFKLPTTSALSGVSVTQAQIEREKALDKRELMWEFERKLEERDKKHEAEINQLRQNKKGGIFGFLADMQDAADTFPMFGDFMKYAQMKIQQEINGAEPVAAINGVGEIDKDLMTIEQTIGTENYRALIKGFADRLKTPRALEFITKLTTFISDFDNGKK